MFFPAERKAGREAPSVRAPTERAVLWSAAALLPNGASVQYIMASKFSEFLGNNKIDPRRIRAASFELERLRPEDRALKLKQTQQRGGDAKPAEGEAPKKPRSGRPVTEQLIARAVEGKPVPGPGKTRILRAVNRILEQKKKDPVNLRALF